MEDYRNEHDDDFVRNDENESFEDGLEMQIDQTIAAYNKKKEKEVNIARPESANRAQTATKSQRMDSAKPGYNKKEFSDRKAEYKYLNSVSFLRSAQNHDVQKKFLQTKKELFYDRFNDYVTNNHISPEDFWNPNKEKLSADEFRECLDIIGFTFSRDEFEDIMFDITDTDFHVSLPAFCSKIDVWKSYFQDRALENLKDHAMKIVQETKKKVTSADSKKKNMMIRPMSGTLYGSTTRPFSGISAISTKSKNTLYSTHDYNKASAPNLTQNLSPMDKTAYYLKIAKDKAKKQEEILSININKGKREYEYDFLMKIQEANEMNQILQDRVVYTSFRAADGELRSVIFEDKTEVNEKNPKSNADIQAEAIAITKQLENTNADYLNLVDKNTRIQTIKEFLREYKTIKQRYNEKLNVKIWDKSTSNKKKANFYFSSQKVTSVPKEDKQAAAEAEYKKITTKAKRQEELQSALYDTMKLTNTLKSQLKKLENAGLVYESHHSKF